METIAEAEVWLAAQRLRYPGRTDTERLIDAYEAGVESGEVQLAKDAIDIAEERGHDAGYEAGYDAGRDNCGAEVTK